MIIFLITVLVILAGALIFIAAISKDADWNCEDCIHMYDGSDCARCRNGSRYEE